MPLVNSHEWIKKIAEGLFKAEERRLETIRDQLVASNKELYPNQPHDGFTYQGKVYDTSNLVRGVRTRVSLHLSLVYQMDKYLKDVEQIWGDRYYISQILFLMLQPCNSLQEIRDVLPNCLVDTLPELQGFQRTREEAFTITSNIRYERQYRKALARMEFYATARLLY